MRWLRPIAPKTPARCEMRRGRHPVAEIAELRSGSLLERIAENPGHHQKKRAVERHLSVPSGVDSARPILSAIHQISGLISLKRIQRKFCINIMSLPL